VRVLLCVLGMAIAAPAAARPRPDVDPDRHVGVMADFGVPDGGTASVVVRMSMFRLNAGVGSNLVTTGYRAGITIAPLATWVSPTLSLDVGRYPEGDANSLGRIVTQDASYHSPMLEHVGYDYLDAHVGLELGRRWSTFYIHGGMSRVAGNVRGLSDPSKGVTFTEDPRATVWAPSVKVGVIFYAF